MAKLGDLLPLNYSTFDDYVERMYSTELEIKDTTVKVKATYRIRLIMDLFLHDHEQHEGCHT